MISFILKNVSILLGSNILSFTSSLIYSKISFWNMKILD